MAKDLILKNDEFSISQFCKKFNVTSLTVKSFNVEGLRISYRNNLPYIKIQDIFDFIEPISPITKEILLENKWLTVRQLEYNYDFSRAMFMWHLQKGHFEKYEYIWSDRKLGDKILTAWDLKPVAIFKIGNGYRISKADFELWLQAVKDHDLLNRYK